MKEKQSIYNIHLKNVKRKNDKVITADEEQHEGLGGLPKNLSSVSSLLLFNTEENPYKRYVTIDPLRGAVTRTREGKNEREKGREKEREKRKKGMITAKQREKVEREQGKVKREPNMSQKEKKKVVEREKVRRVSRCSQASGRDGSAAVGNCLL